MPCVACTYMPNASWRRRGGKAQGRGLPTLEAEAKLERKGRSEAEVCTSEARKIGDALVAAPGQRPQRGLVSLFACVSTQELSGSRCGRNRPLGWAAENAQWSQRGRRLPPVERGFGVDKHSRLSHARLPSEVRCRMMEVDGYAPSWVSKPKQKHRALVRHGPNSQRLASGSHRRMSRLHG
jgi:hypothetical protein